MSPFSTLLFADPSFSEGMARVLDINGSLNIYNSSLTGAQADYWALAADWRAVGQDLREVEMAEYCRLVHKGMNHVQAPEKSADR